MTSKEAAVYCSNIFNKMGYYTTWTQPRWPIFTINECGNDYLRFFRPQFVRLNGGKRLLGVIGLIEKDILTKERLKEITSYIFMSIYIQNFDSLVCGPIFGNNLFEDQIWCHDIIRVLEQIPASKGDIEKALLNDITIEGLSVRSMGFGMYGNS